MLIKAQDYMASRTMKSVGILIATHVHAWQSGNHEQLSPWHQWAAANAPPGSCLPLYPGVLSCQVPGHPALAADWEGSVSSAPGSCRVQRASPEGGLQTECGSWPGRPRLPCSSGSVFSIIARHPFVRAANIHGPFPPATQQSRPLGGSKDASFTADADRSRRRMALAVWDREANSRLDKHVNCLVCWLGIRAKVKERKEREEEEWRRWVREGWVESGGYYFPPFNLHQ